MTGTEGRRTLQIVLPNILKAFRRVRGLTQEVAAELAAVARLSVSMDEARAALERVYAMFTAASGDGEDG